MAIRVKFVGDNHSPAPAQEVMISLPKGSTVADLLAELKIVSAEEHMISRNSELISPTTTLRDGDHVCIYALRRG